MRKSPFPGPSPFAAGPPPPPRVPKLEREKPVLPGFAFSVQGTGPFVLECVANGDKTSLTVENDKFPTASWAELIDAHLKAFFGQSGR